MAAFAFRLPEPYATACATCYLPLDEIRITGGWQRQRVAAPRGSASLHHRACVLRVPGNTYRDCPEADAQFEYDPDLACVCGTAVARSTARMERRCVVVAHPASDREAPPHLRLYHEACVLGGEAPVVDVLACHAHDRQHLDDLTAVAFVTDAKLAPRERAMHVLAPGYALCGVPVFAWVKSHEAADRGERASLARHYFECARRALPPDLLRLGARRVPSDAVLALPASEQAAVLCRAGAYAYLECETPERGAEAGVYPFLATASGATGETGARGGGVSLGLIRLADGSFLVPPRWVERVKALCDKERAPTLPLVHRSGGGKKPRAAAQK